MITPPWAKPAWPVLRLEAPPMTRDAFAARVFDIAKAAPDAHAFARSRPLRRLMLDQLRPPPYGVENRERFRLKTAPQRNFFG